jgi:hypothetical protein
MGPDTSSWHDILTALRRTSLRPRSGFALLIVLFSGAWSSSASAQAAKPRAPSLELPASRQSLAVRGAFGPSEVRFWACPPRGACTEPASPLKVALPEGLAPEHLERKPLKAGELQLLRLVAREGGPFELLIAPPAVDSTGAASSAAAAEPLPTALLQGPLGKDESLRALPDGKLIVARSVRACDDPNGRELLVDVRRFDETKRAFVRARLSLLDDAELNAAEPLELSPASSELPSPIAPLAGSTSEAQSWIYGQGTGEIPWATLSFAPEAGSKLRLELAPGPDTALLLLLGSKTHTLKVPASTSPRVYELPLSALLAPEEGSETPACALLTTGAAGAPVRKVSFSRADRPYGSPETWVRELSGQEPALYQKALTTDLAAAARAIQDEFPSLDSAGRARAIEILLDTPGELALGPLVTIAALGSEVERERADNELDAYDAERVFEAAAGEFSPKKGPRAASFARVMAQAAPDKALLPLARSLGETARSKTKNPKRREEELEVRRTIRAALRTAVANAEHPEEIEELLKDSRQKVATRRELLRAAGAHRKKLGFSLAPFLTELASGFEGEYVLLELLLELDTELEPKLRSRIEGRLAGQADADWQPVHLFAYQTRLLELLTERPLSPETRARFLAGTESALSSPSRVVRTGALLFLREVDPRKARAAEARVLELLDRDEWLEVRAEAAITYGTLSAALPEADKDRAEEALASRLRKNKEELSLARALVRALAKSGGPRARAELRSALEKKGPAQLRGDAAEALGRLCETSAIDELTTHALVLSRPTTEGDVTLGLAAARALARLAPSDLEKRLQPLREKSVPGPIQGQLSAILESTPNACSKK